MDDHEMHGHGGDHAANHAVDHAGHDPATFRRRFWVSLGLTIPILLTGGMLGLPEVAWVGPILGTIVLLWGGWPFLVGGFHELHHRSPGMMLLISMALVVAFAASVATTAGLVDLDFWWELAALVTIMLLGHWLELRAVGQARGALAALSALLPDQAERVNVDGTIESVPRAVLVVGDLVLVRPGGRVPADATIVEGGADLDESMITGESRPVARGVGDTVVAGTVAADGALRLRVDAVGEQTALAGIARLVAQAQQSSGRAQALADRFAALLFYVATSAAVVTFVAWWIAGDRAGALTRTVTVLVIACPHALGLAIPLVVAISTSIAARQGILVKDRLALERMRTVDAVLFDKTGTLTTGRPAVTGVVAGRGLTRDDVLRLAAAVEADSEHPLARAIVVAARTHPAATGFRSLTGRGAQATVDGWELAVGGPALLRDLAVTPLTAAAGATVLHLISVEDRLAVGAITLADQVRPEAAEAIETLRAAGVRRVAMVTGDARDVAEAVAAQLGIDEVFAEVLPADKDHVVADLQRRGLRVAMVGDGVNDAPALARADVGIAIGAGTDVAIESAGVILAAADPRGVLAVRRLSAATYRKMIQNLAWAAGYNIVAIPLAAGALAWAGVTLDPAVGAVLMSLSTIIVALNAQLLRRQPTRSGASGS